MKFDRGWRRAQNERLKKNRKSYWTGSHWENDSRRLGMLLNNPKNCSCAMCGNPRKYNKGKPEGLTIQERRLTQKEGGCHAIVYLEKEHNHEQNLSPSRR